MGRIVPPEELMQENQEQDVLVAEPAPEAAAPELVVVPEPVAPESPAPVLEVKPEPVKPESATNEPEAKPEPEAKTESVDPALQKIMDAYKAGRLEEYLKISTTDYDKMSAEQIIKLDLRKQWPSVSEKALDTLYQDKLKNEFKISGDYEDDNAVGIELMEAKANMIRDGLKAEQANYQIPAYQPDPEAEQLRVQQEQQVIQIQQHLESHPALTAFETNRKITIGEGDEAFHFEADPMLDVRATLTSNSFYEDLWKQGPNGPQFDMETWILFNAIKKDKAKFFKTLIDHGRTLGKKEEFNELRNAGDAVTTQAAPTPQKSRIIGIARNGSDDDDN